MSIRGYIPDGPYPVQWTRQFKIGQGRKLVKKVKILKVLRMGLPIVENLGELQESIFSLYKVRNSILIKIAKENLYFVSDITSRIELQCRETPTCVGPSLHCA